MLEVTYYGNATFAVSSDATTLVIDPYFTDNDECPWDVHEAVDREEPDAVCITHAAFDHIGDAPVLAGEYGLPVITEGATGHYLESEGIPGTRIAGVIWGMEAAVGDLTVRVLEARHSSSRVVDGDFVSGVPLAFLVGAGDASVFHAGDTSIGGHLGTIGDLYAPDVSLIGVGQAFDAASEDEGPAEVTRTIHELSPDEAATAARWLGSDRVVPMHYLPHEREQFLAAMEEEKPTAVPLEAGESITV